MTLHEYKKIYEIYYNKISNGEYIDGTQFTRCIDYLTECLKSLRSIRFNNKNIDADKVKAIIAENNKRIAVIAEIILLSCYYKTETIFIHKLKEVRERALYALYYHIYNHDTNNLHNLRFCITRWNLRMTDKEFKKLINLGTKKDVEYYSKTLTAFIKQNKLKQNVINNIQNILNCIDARLVSLANQKFKKPNVAKSATVETTVKTKL